MANLSQLREKWDSIDAQQKELDLSAKDLSKIKLGYQEIKHSVGLPAKDVTSETARGLKNAAYELQGYQQQVTRNMKLMIDGLDIEKNKFLASVIEKFSLFF